MAHWLGYTIIPAKLPLSYSFCSGLLNIIYLADQKDIWHEVGHAFFNKFQRDLESAGVKEVFGNHNRLYFHLSFYLKDWDERFEDDSDFPSKYAQTHPSEDWAECFQVLARNKFKMPVCTGGLKSKYEFILEFLKKI